MAVLMLKAKKKKTKKIKDPLRYFNPSSNNTLMRHGVDVNNRPVRNPQRKV
jgi:hypothetical protein